MKWNQINDDHYNDTEEDEVSGIQTTPYAA